MLIDVLSDPLDFRYRLSGTAICEVLGGEPRTKGPRDLPPVAYGQLIYDHYCLAVSRRTPLLHLVILSPFDPRRSYARLLLPLSEDGSTISMLISIHSKEENIRSL